MSCRIRRILLAALLALIAAFSFPALFGPWVGVVSGPGVQAVAPASTAESLLQTGIERYEAEQFAAAIEVWSQALKAFEAEADSLRQALLQSNLSLAYQQLGQWRQADEALSASLALLAGWEDEEQSPAYLETFAKALNTQGRLQWTQGDIEAALATWRQATIAYTQAGQVRGMALSLINQAKALQVQGLHVQAKAILEQQVYPILQRQPLDPALKATGLWRLANAQRRIGDLEASLKTLQESLEMAEEFQLDPLQGWLWLDLGNTQRALGDQAIAIGKTDQATVHRDAALAAYQRAAIVAPATITQLQADLNQLSLLIGADRLAAAAALWPTLEMTDLPLNRTAIYAQLNFAQSLTKLKAAGGGRQGTEEALEWVEIGQFLAGVVQQARALKDPIAESYAIGQLGELYELRGQWPQAQALTEKALRLAEAAQYPDGRYRWEWQLGRLLKQQGKQGEAITAYSAAVETLALVRNDLLFIDAEVQFSFRDNVEPVYRGLVELLLSSEERPQPSQANLQQAIQRIDNLQLNELENFLRCNLAQTGKMSQFEDDPAAAILYPIILEERLAVILELPDPDQPLRFAQVLTPQPQVEEVLQQLRRDLSEAPDRTPEVRTAAQVVYEWLIAPFESALAQNPQIETLVFVLDGSLRNIPMAVLYDGDQYLIEKYAIAIAPRLDLFNPSPLSQQLEVFVGGIGKPQTIEGRTFSKIENLVAELVGIGRDLNTNPPLLETDFTTENLQQQLSHDDFSVIHLKTHGVFSSDPEETFIVAYQELIRGRDLGALIQTSNRQAETPIELLVLSACSTAQGDNRAVLGLAGIAVQAGVRSAISTLWEAQDRPNTQLMIHFYQKLSNPGTSRAQALRQAQLAIFEQGYKAPHIWATYVLVGNWL